MYLKLSAKEQLIINWLFFCLAIIFINSGLGGIFGFGAALLYFLSQNVILSDIFCGPVKQKFLLSFFTLLNIYIIGLSLIYYLFGLNQTTIIAWLALGLIPSYFVKNDFFLEIKKPFFSFSISDFIIIIFSSLIIFAVGLEKTYNGNPSPWTSISGWVFVLFFITTLLILLKIEKKNQIISCVVYFFMFISVVALKYGLTFGFDALLHQASLEYIDKFGRIFPLTPYYIGQYSLEVYVHKFSNWDFILIERWFEPLFCILLISFMTYYFINSLGKKSAKFNYFIIPLSVLILIPNQFFFTAPYNFSLLLGIVSVSFVYLYLKTKNEIEYRLGLLTAFSVSLIHPIIGINIFIAAFFSKYYNTEKKYKLYLTLLFVLSSIAPAAAFIFFNWLKDSRVFLSDPIFYLNNFISIFNDPIWYIKSQPPLLLSIVYSYEKYYLVFFMALVYLYYRTLKNKRAENYLILIAFSFLIASWLFISSIEVEGYTFGDQINYSFRLLQAVKWLLWPIVLAIICDNIGLLSGKYKKLFISMSVALLLTLNWYLTYPRQDDISRMNINNVRSSDYYALELINKTEKGKQGYLVLANQILGAAAIKKYGFGPYYESNGKQIFYYSIPMGSELNNLYEKIMNSEDFPVKEINETGKKWGIPRIYLIFTDYWMPDEKIIKQIESVASNQWNIDDSEYVYFFNLPIKKINSYEDKEL
jgi:hypothetical protein